MLFIWKMFILQKIFQLIIIIINTIFCISKYIISEISQVSKQFGRRLSKFALLLIWMTTELKIQKYQDSVSMYIYNWNNFSSYQKNQLHQLFIKI